MLQSVEVEVESRVSSKMAKGRSCLALFRMKPNLRGLFTKGSRMWKGSGDGSEDGSRGQGFGNDRVDVRGQRLQDNREICGAKALG